MSPQKVIIVKRWNEVSGEYKSVHLTNQNTIQAVEDWLKKNEKGIPATEEVGAVIPEFEISITEDGDINSPSARHIEIYGELDRGGYRAISSDEISAFKNILAQEK